MAAANVADIDPVELAEEVVGIALDGSDATAEECGDAAYAVASAVLRHRY